MRVKVKHHPHGRARWLVRLLGLPFRLFPLDFDGWADDTITRMGVHATTHIDAPWHYGPTDAEGGGCQRSSRCRWSLASDRAWCST
ncbi:hypothetical protein ACFSKM_14460 [Ancylobacter dichloromethanicus]